jgi:hypothetical protein
LVDISHCYRRVCYYFCGVDNKNVERLTKKVKTDESHLKHFVVLVLLLPLVVWAHGGGLNAEGCHNNRKTGDYHCHRAPSTQNQASQGTETVTRSQPSRPSQGIDPTCHVGPRGGTYTITPSGRKNYNGC